MAKYSDLVLVTLLKERIEDEFRSIACDELFKKKEGEKK